MLKLFVKGREWFNDDTQEFHVIGKDCILQLEHSLISLSKWESKWKKPFLDDVQQRSDEEFLDYIRCMTINQGVDPMIYYSLTDEQILRIRDYIKDPMTATTIRRSQTRNKRPVAKKITTSELIYSWMVLYGIPFECQKWHLNRLMTLIEVCSTENGGSKKMSKSDIMKENAAINAMRRAKHNTKG